MPTEAKIEDIPAIVNDEAEKRAQDVANAAASQIDDANKTAEALARAAESGHLGTRIEELKRENETWRATMEQRIAETQTATAAAVEASRLSILEAISKPPQAPPIVEEVLPKAGVSGEQENNSSQTDTTKEKTPASRQQRVRHVL